MSREINAGRYAELARAIFGTIEHQPAELADELHGVVALAVDRPEWAWLRGERHWQTINLSEAATPALFSGIGIHNPDKSGTLVVVRYGCNTSAQTAVVKMGTVTATEPGAIVQTVIITQRDLRGYPAYPPGDGSEPNSAARIFRITSAGVAQAANGLLQPVASGELSRTNPQWWVVLGPNTYVLLEGATINTAMSAYFGGYELPLVQGVRA